MKKHLSCLLLSMIFASSLLVLQACGGPKGGFVDLKIDDPDALVSIDNAKEVPYGDLSLPIDLEPVLHKFTVKFSKTGDVVTKYTNVSYKETSILEFKQGKPVEITVNCPLPCKVKIGGQEAGDTRQSNKFNTVPGKRLVEIETLGFGIKMSKEIETSVSATVDFTPGVDKDTGAIYIQSKDKNSKFDISPNHPATSNEGSIFIQKLPEGAYKITEKSTLGVEHWVNVKKGSISKIIFDKSLPPSSTPHELKFPARSRLELFVNWENQGTTVSEITEKFDDTALYTATPFLPFGMSRFEGISYIKATQGERFGFATIYGKFPKTIEIRLEGKNRQSLMSRPSLASLQEFSLSSPDGTYYYDESAIVTAGGFYYGISDYIPCDWDMENERTLVTRINRDCNQIEIREAPLKSSAPWFFPTYLPKKPLLKNPQFEFAYAFWLDKDNVLGVYGNNESIHVWKTRRNNMDTPTVLNIPAASCSLIGKKYLAVRKNPSKDSPYYMIDMATKKISKELSRPVLTKDGLFATTLSRNGACAGALLKWSGDSLEPVFVGLFLP
ncbi:MAG: hypothetical protein GX421_06350 [Caldisericales bacterium]|nr:hypothetical protein [Caldisericales bacterium]